MASKKPQIVAEVAQNRFSFQAFSDFVNQNFSLIIVLLMAFALGFLSGSLWTENKMLKNGTSPTGVADAADPSAQAAAAAKKLEDTPKFDPNKDHYRGNKDAKVVMIEYSDYECPFCNRFHPTMKAIMEKYSKDIVWVYRHFPLSFHPHAQILAEASECVAKDAGNDVFWKFSDSVYEKMADGSIYDVNTPEKKSIETASIVKLAQASGANASNVQACLDSKEMTQLVKDQMAAASKAGISGTPGTVIISKQGGRELVPGALPIEQLETMLEKHL